MTNKLCLFILLLSMASASWAVTPMAYYNTLVAGADESGYRDGSFIRAYFNTPSGIAFNAEGDKLYVADSSNNRIRVIDLAHQNAVQTLAGTGAGGETDGVLDKATFNSPRNLAVLADGRVAVYDAAGNQVRLIDVKAQTVTTIAKGISLWNLVYRSQDDSLYFSQPDSQSLYKLALKTLAITSVLLKDPQVLWPYALCVNGDKLDVSDRATSKVFEVTLGGKNASLKEVGQGMNILGLAVSGETLYAIQTGKTPLIRVSPSGNSPVHLATPWGFLADDDNSGVEPYMDFRDSQIYGFAVSPTEPEKLYLTRINLYRNGVISVVDDNFSNTQMLSSTTVRHGELSDFNYREKKPRDTYRILMMGDSRTALAIRDTADIGDKAEKGTGSYRIDTIPKQLEMFLNSEATLRDIPTHFEVLTLSRPDKPLSDYVEDEVTPLVKRYDVDLVLGLTGEADVKKGELDSTIASLVLLSKAMQSLKMSSGDAPKLVFVHVPAPGFKNDIDRLIWKDICDKCHLTFIDLTEPFDGLKTSYYPTAEKGNVPAYTAYGCELIANILSGYLENNQIVPFEAVKK